MKLVVVSVTAAVDGCEPTYLSAEITNVWLFLAEIHDQY